MVANDVVAFSRIHRAIRPRWFSTLITLGCLAFQIGCDVTAPNDESFDNPHDAYSLVNSDALVSSDSQDAFTKPNHSPVWEHDGVVWGALLRKTDSKTWIWKRNSAGSWSVTPVKVHDRLSDRCDVIPDSPANRVYIFASHDTECRLTALTYAGANGSGGGSWTIDPNVNRSTIKGIGDTIRTTFAYTSRWASPIVFAFEYEGTTIEVNWSTNGGQTWRTTPTPIATNARIGNDTGSFLIDTGLPDATEYSVNGINYVGLFFGEESGINGFLSIQEGANPADVSNWIYEEVPLWEIGPASEADDHVSLVRDDSSTNNTLFAGCKSGYGETNYGVFRRTPDGVWTLSEVQFSGRRPGIQYDASGDLGYLIVTNTTDGAVTYRTFSPSALVFGPETTLIVNNADDFRDGGGAHTPWHGSNLIFVAGNRTTNRAWEGVISLDLP